MDNLFPSPPDSSDRKLVIKFNEMINYINNREIGKLIKFSKNNDLEELLNKISELIGRQDYLISIYQQHEKEIDDDMKRIIDVRYDNGCIVATAANGTIRKYPIAKSTIESTSYETSEYLDIPDGAMKYFKLINK